ncbi:MAG TPA: cyclic nucleotide-binding domain-containing protein [Kiloniellales bacterium]|nr:cyclic nucleotide-binding domain-containing protein [Kiloniellales bacterium]
MEMRRFAAGETLFREGDASGEAFVIRAGRIEILKDSARGPLRLAVLGSGDVVGEMGLLEDRPRSATARALDPVTADAVSRAEFLRLILHEPQQALDLLRALFDRLRSANQLLAEAGRERPAAAAGLPGVALHPASPETAAELPEAGLAVERFPFRVGRKPDSPEEAALAFNDVALADPRPHRMSLNHFALDLAPDGVVVRDRGSREGTLVNGRQIGARGHRDYAALVPGDNEIIAGFAVSSFGAPPSPWRFRVTLSSG